MPKDLGMALFYSASAEGKDIWKEFYDRDVLEVGKAARGGRMNLRGLFSGSLGALNPMQFRPSKLKSIADDTKMPLLNFLDLVGRDLEKQKTKAEKLSYVLKVGTLFVTSAVSFTAGLRVATLGLAPNKLGKRPWIPSLGLVLGASALARLLDHAVQHLEADSEDRELANFLKANFEIFAYGGSLGVLEVPSFVSDPGDDASLRAVRQLIRELVGNPEGTPSGLIE